MRFDPTRRVAAAIVVLTFPDLEPVAHASAVRIGARPYVPGYLGFREVPVLADAWAALSIRPDLLLVDGHGIAHPRGFGVAAHLGAVLDIPTIGVAKSKLAGEPASLLADAAGAEVPLLLAGRVVGACLRTRRGAGALYVSPGHRVSVAAAAGWVWRCGSGRRLPEPIRQAHLAANRARLA